MPFKFKYMLNEKLARIYFFNLDSRKITVQINASNTDKSCHLRQTKDRQRREQRVNMNIVRDVTFGSKLGQIDPKWDTSRTF